MSKPVKWVTIAAIVTGFVVVGYLRDFVFININYHLHYIQNNSDYSSAHSFFDFLNNFSFRQIYSAKYALTALFTAFNFLLGMAFLRILFGRGPIIKIYWGIYVAVIIVAALFFGGGYMLNDIDGGYHFSRILMGFLQSPLPAAVIALGYPLYKQ